MFLILGNGIISFQDVFPREWGPPWISETLVAWS